MPKYNRGYETKNKIVNAAKQLFYDKGIAATKIIEICKIAGVSSTNFKYYFDNKYDIANEISGSLLVNVYNFIDLHTDSSIKLNSVQKNITSAMLFYPIIFSDDKNILYYYEVLKNKSVFSVQSKNVRRIYQRYIIDLNLDISEDDFKYISAGDLGIRRELALEFIEKEYDITVYEFVAKIYFLTGRLFKIDDALISQYIEEALKFANSHDFSLIKFLV